jgi:hypothetical protein
MDIERLAEALQMRYQVLAWLEPASTVYDLQQGTVAAQATRISERIRDSNLS